MVRALLTLVLLTACGHDEPIEPTSDPRVDKLREVYNAALQEAEGLKDANGWLVPTDGDGMLWSAKASAGGLSGFKPEAAEREPGRFVRCPATPENCEESDNEWWSDWSRDMFNGLLWHAWRTKDRDVLERHLAYGRSHNWIMGRPLGDGRSVYLPATYGRLYQAIFALGGNDDSKRLWPDVYPSGLTDFTAHHQMLNIGFRAEVEEFLREGDARPATDMTDDVGGDQVALTDVNDTQLDRIKEHAGRDPRDPFFQCLAGIYSGDFGPALDAALASDMYAGEYVRCDEYRRCQLASWLFAAKCILRRF